MAAYGEDEQEQKPEDASPVMFARAVNSGHQARRQAPV